jgi:hypothetical protein
MTDNAEALERQLVDDLAVLGDQLANDQLATDVYRALANTTWHREGGHVALSWSRAEAAVNELRAQHGRDPLELAQTGGEGEVSDVVADALAAGGWSARPLNTERHDPQHVAQPESAPPPDTGQRLSPDPDATDWEREAHEEAERNRRPSTP